MDIVVGLRRVTVVTVKLHSHGATATKLFLLFSCSNGKLMHKYECFTLPLPLTHRMGSEPIYLRHHCHNCSSVNESHDNTSQVCTEFVKGREVFDQSDLKDLQVFIQLQRAVFRKTNGESFQKVSVFKRIS